MSDTFLTLILTGMGTAITSLAGWSWFQISKERARSDELVRQVALKDVELAIAKTQLAAYGGSSPLLADKVDHLTDLVLGMIGEDPPEYTPKQLPWPSRPQRPRRHS